MKLVKIGKELIKLKFKLNPNKDNNYMKNKNIQKLCFIS